MVKASANWGGVSEVAGPGLGEAVRYLKVLAVEPFHPPYSTQWECEPIAAGSAAVGLAGEG